MEKSVENKNQLKILFIADNKLHSTAKGVLHEELAHEVTCWDDVSTVRDTIDEDQYDVYVCSAVGGKPEWIPELIPLLQELKKPVVYIDEDTFPPSGNLLYLSQSSFNKATMNVLLNEVIAARQT